MAILDSSTSKLEAELVVIGRTIWAGMGGSQVNRDRRLLILVTDFGTQNLGIDPKARNKIVDASGMSRRLKRIGRGMRASGLSRAKRRVGVCGVWGGSRLGRRVYRGCCGIQVYKSSSVVLY